MNSLKSLQTCLDLLDDKHCSHLSGHVDVSGRVYTVDEKVRFLQSLLLLMKEFPDKADSVCIYLLHHHPIGRGFIEIKLLQSCQSTNGESLNGTEASIRDLCKELGLLVKRIFCEGKGEEEDEYKRQTECQVLNQSRSILLSNIAATFVDDYDKCYRSERRNRLRRHIVRLKSDGREVDGVSHFPRYCDMIKSLWNEERCSLSQTSLKRTNSVFALYWEILVHELEIILDRFVTTTDDVGGTRQNTRFFGGSVTLRRLRSSGEILISNEDDLLNQTLTQCRSYPTGVKAIVGLAQDCWSLEKFMLSSLNYSEHNMILSNEDVLSTTSHPYSDYMGSTEPTMNSNWRALFLPFLGDLIDTIDREICFDTSAAIQEEWEQFQVAITTHVIDERVVVTDSHNLRVLRSVRTLCDASANYLPLAELAGLRLAPLRTSFVDKIRRQCVEIQNHLLKIGRLVPHSASVSILYVSLGSIFKLKTILKDCHEKLESEGLDYTCYDLEKVELSLIEQVTLYHQDVIANCILQDDEAHNWESSKPFYENECCSFSIRQWYLHLLALRHDLWSIIPSNASVQIFTRVLENSLRIFACRYSAIKPSFVRTKQMKADIVAILLCTSHLLEFTSSNLLEFFAVTQNADDSVLQQNIHNFSTSLISTLIVVTAPLKALYKAFKKGFVVSDSLKKIGYHWNWLTIGQNAVWRECRNEYDQNTTLSLSIKLKLLCNQPTDGNWPLLLQVLFDLDHAVARLFLVFPSIASLTNSSPLSSSDDGTDTDLHPYECFKSLMYASVYLDWNCSSFAEIFMLWMRNKEMKPDFFMDSINGSNQNIVEMDVISELLRPFIDSVVNVLALHLMPFVDLDDNCLVRMSKLVNDGSEFNLHEVVIETIELFLRILPANLAFIPDTFCHLFVKLQELEDPSIKKMRHSLPFRCLCAIIGFVLSRNERLWHFATTLKPGLTMTIFSQVSKLLLSLGSVNSTGLGISTDFLTRLIGIQSSIDNANEYVRNYFALTSENIHHCNASDNLGIVANLYRNPKGIEHLKCLQQFLIRFKDWFIDSLGQFKCATKSKAYKTESPRSSCRNSAFNPFEHFGLIGDTGYTFDQDSLVSEVQFDWERLIRENLFVSKVAFSTLLYRRWEFNLETDLEASNLQHDERKYVSVLREIFVCST